MPVTRRGLLAGAAVGGGLLVAWTLYPRQFDPPLSPGDDEFAFDVWLKIGRDGVVTVALPQMEMGQGVSTILPQIVAVELGADWRQIAVEPAPISGAYANVALAARWSSLWMPAFSGLAEGEENALARRYAQQTQFTATADGTSLATFEQPCRLAAAAARMMMIEVAAERWGVDEDICDADAGFVIAGKRRVAFADLAEAAAGLSPPSSPILRAKPAAESPLPDGQMAGPVIEGDPALSARRFPRIDLPSKVDGSHIFAGDVRLPDMVYAAIKHGPLDKAALTHFDADAVTHHPGLTAVVKGKRWLAAVANDWWSANRAVEAMKPRFSVEGLVDSETMETRLDEAIRSGSEHIMAQIGGGAEAMGEIDIARRYDVAAALHAPLETASVTARFMNGRLEMWIASQAPQQTKAAAAKAIGIAQKDVVLYPMPAGGSFDRRLEHDHAIEAAMIARELSLSKPRPVQLIYSRWQEHVMGLPRTPAAGLLSARYAKGGNGAIEALRSRIAVPATGQAFGRRVLNNETRWSARRRSANDADPLAVEGALPQYKIPNVTVDHVPTEIGLSTGRMRGNAHSYTAFFTESFIDEIAADFGREPLSYRIEMLHDDVRMVACLQRAARSAGWDGGRDQSGKGLACHWIGPSQSAGRIACVAIAKPGEGGIRVSRLTAAVDIGRIVNLDIARQQIEGGLIFGMSLALGSSTGYSAGLPNKGRLAELDLPLLSDCPEIEVEFIESDKEPVDPGELGVAVAPPAVANALYSASGLRFRRLPLFAEGL